MDTTDNQGKVVQAARERSRGFLRAEVDFAWDATNLSRQIRGDVIQLLLDYDARVRVVYVEVPFNILQRQNQERPRQIPWKAIEKMMRRWEVPDRTEAHEILYATS